MTNHKVVLTFQRDSDTGNDRQGDGSLAVRGSSYPESRRTSRKTTTPTRRRLRHRSIGFFFCEQLPNPIHSYLVFVHLTVFGIQSFNLLLLLSVDRTYSVEYESPDTTGGLFTCRPYTGTSWGAGAATLPRHTRLRFLPDTVGQRTTNPVRETPSFFPLHDDPKGFPTRLHHQIPSTRPKVRMSFFMPGSVPQTLTQLSKGVTLILHGNVVPDPTRLGPRVPTGPNLSK